MCATTTSKEKKENEIIKIKYLFIEWMVINGFTKSLLLVQQRSFSKRLGLERELMFDQ